MQFSGYQFQGLHPDEAYCRVLPFSGFALLKLEPLNESATEKKVALRLMKWNMFSAPHVYPLKTTGFQSFKEVVLLQANALQAGLYALEIRLQTSSQHIQHTRFYFLVGIALTKLLVWFSLTMFVLITVFFVYSLRKKS